MQIACKLLANFGRKENCENENYSVMYASINIILDTRRMKIKTGKYPIKLRVTFNRVSRDYQTIYDLTENEFNRLTASRISSELQLVRDKLNDIKIISGNFIKELDPFNFAEFENDFIKDKQFFRNRTFKKAGISLPSIEFDFSPFMKRFSWIFEEDHSRPGTISIVYLFYIKTLLQQGRIGSAINYLTSYRSLKKFKGNVLFTDITVNYLFEYEQWMLNRNVTKTYVGIVLRALRTIFNEAIELRIIKREKCYPFGRRKYQIPSSRNEKKALGMDDMKRIYYYEPFCELQKKAKDFWLFCYFANGMNVKDMLFLKYKNIQGEYLFFERAKTQRTARTDTKQITVYMTQDILDIIKRQGSKTKSPNDYVFPIMRPGLTILEQFDLVNFVRSMINGGMGTIRKELGIEKKVTTIVSRHTFSTQLKRSGVSTEFIQEALGHTDKKTTENYLDSFENEMKKEFAGKLTPFKQDRINDFI